MRAPPLVALVIRRLLWSVPVVLAAIVITFALMHLAPGSPWDTAEEGPRIPLTETARQRLDTKYGLDKPWWQQLAVYLANTARLDFGESYRFSGEPVRDLLLSRLPTTLTLAALALAVILPVGVGLGVVAALRHNSRADYVVTGLATLAGSVPNFVVGILLILALSVGLNRATRGTFFLPASGFGLGPEIIMPVITLSLRPVAFIARLARSSTLETLTQPHVRTARASGVPRRRLIVRHVARNSLMPVVTTAGPLVVFLVTGTVVVETLFGIPGVGGALVQAVSTRDYPVILGSTVLYAVLAVVANLAVDVLYGVVDPRIGAA